MKRKLWESVLMAVQTFRTYSSLSGAGLGERKIEVFLVKKNARLSRLLFGFSEYFSLSNCWTPPCFIDLHLFIYAKTWSLLQQGELCTVILWWQTTFDKCQSGFIKLSFYVGFRAKTSYSAGLWPLLVKK